MQDNSWQINYYIFIYHFESRKSGYEGEKKRCLENQKSFSDEIKSIFHTFWKVTIWWKKIKIEDASIQINKDSDWETVNLISRAG